MAPDVNPPTSPSVRPAATPAAPKAQPAADAASPRPAAAPEPAKASPNHVMGFFEGFVREGAETVAGLYTLVTTNPITTAKGLVYMATHPAQAVQAIVEPYSTAYKDGRYGELVGRAGFQVLTIALTSGALSKSDKASKVAKPTATMSQAASQVTDDFARQLGTKKAAAELAGSTLKGAAYNKKLASLGAKYAEDYAARLAKRGLADKLATNIAASGLGDDAVTKIMAAGGKNVGSSQAYRYTVQALKAGMKPEAIAAELTKFGVSKTAAAQLPVATKLVAPQAANASLIAGMANVRSAEAIASHINQLERLASATTDKALKAGYKAQLDAMKAALAANPRTAKLVESALKGIKVGRFERVGQQIGSGVDNIGKAGEKIGEAGKAVKNVLDAPKTVGDYARIIGNVPVAVGAALDAAYEGTVATLRRGLELLPKIALPDVSWKTISAIRVPSPWEILTAPVAVPLGAAGWALKNPGRALGALSLMGTGGNVGKMGELLKAREASDRPEAPPPQGFRYYELRDGDTLEEIARRELGDAGRWGEIYEANKDLFDSLGNEGVIAVGTKIRIPTDQAQAAPAPGEAPAAAPGQAPAEVDASDYKAALLAALDAELAATADPEATKVLTQMRAKIDGMSPAEVLALRPKLEAQGIVVNVPARPSAPATAPAAPQPGVQPGAQAPGNSPAAPSAPAGEVQPSAPTAPAEGPRPPAPPAPHVVRPGDTLWDIAGRRLGDEQRWGELVEQNGQRYPSLNTNPDFILPGWRLDLPVSGSPTAPVPVAPGTPPAAAPVAPAPVTPPSAAPVAPAPAPAAPAAPTGEQRDAIVKQFGLASGEANFQNFWSEISTYPTAAVGPDTGTVEDRKGLQSLLQRLGYDVEATGDYYRPGPDGKPQLDARGLPVSPTADAVMHFKRLAGIKQGYQVAGPDGKAVADVNEYVDARTREAMTVTLRLLQNPALRQQATMEAVAREAARLQGSSIGPEVGTPDARKLVQQYLDGLGYKVPITGQFDQATLDAVLDFKQKNGIAAGFRDDAGQPVYTPYVDGRTADAMLSALQAQASSP
ncbi:MAG: peptidoglycan-binding protein [Candidatus Sericytochromatia bacterium]|nr:peptidoglycan-binding protein [Candidatus Sericytochromatia bacterium]